MRLFTSLVERKKMLEKSFKEEKYKREKLINKSIVLPLANNRFSVGDKVNYCNGLIFEIARINEEAGVCYDNKGMWYALINCVKMY